jgi:peptidoglycan hydrolase-like protein with peptidoglycan-binding domain
MRFLVTSLLMLCAVPAAAEKALLIGVPAGETRVFGANVPDVDKALRTGGFRVIRADGSSVQAMRDGLSKMLAEIATERLVVIYLDGRFARSVSDTWLLADNMPAQPDLATVAGQGLALSTVMEVASAVPGGAVVLLGEDTGRATLGAGLQSGIGVLNVPQGVTVLSGDADVMIQFTAKRLLRLGADVAGALQGAQGVTAQGLVTNRLRVIETQTSQVPRNQPGTGANAAVVEQAIWEATQAQDTISAYQGYLQRYPLGQFADDARKMITEIGAEPFRAQRKAEEALDLSRDERRQIQRHLTILEYNPRGIDGIFGRGTRAAITAFQKADGFPQSGYLTTRQIERLALRAERRTAELEAEAERRRLQAEEQDRVYWSATGAVGDEAGLRTYLNKYPDGLFSVIATDRLQGIEQIKRGRAEAQDRAAWDQAVATNTLQSYRTYLEAYPDGSFATAAQAQVDEARNERSEERQQAEAAEAALNLNPITRVLIERRLDQLGLEPGRADGEFDRDTRKAIRRFQRDRELPVTGFMDEATVVRMLSDAGINLR